MKHPIIKLFLSRLRALGAARRAGWPVERLEDYLTPFARHTLLVERNAAGDHVIAAAGEAVERLFARKLVGEPVAALFAVEDRPHVAAMIDGASRDGLAFLFGAAARHSAYRETRLEGALAPDGPRPGRGAACILSFGFPRGWGRRPLPPLRLTGQRFMDMDGPPGAAPRPARRPQFTP